MAWSVPTSSSLVLTQLPKDRHETRAIQSRCGQFWSALVAII